MCIASASLYARKSAHQGPAACLTLFTVVCHTRRFPLQINCLVQWRTPGKLGQVTPSSILPPLTRKSPPHCTSHCTSMTCDQQHMMSKDALQDNESKDTHAALSDATCEHAILQ